MMKQSDLSPEDVSFLMARHGVRLDEDARYDTFEYLYQQFAEERVDGRVVVSRDRDNELASAYL